MEKPPPSPGCHHCIPQCHIPAALQHCWVAPLLPGRLVLSLITPWSRNCSYHPTWPCFPMAANSPPKANPLCNSTPQRTPGQSHAHTLQFLTEFGLAKGVPDSPKGAHTILWSHGSAGTAHGLIPYKQISSNHANHSSNHSHKAKRQLKTTEENPNVTKSPFSCIIIFAHHVNQGRDGLVGGSICRLTSGRLSGSKTSSATCFFHYIPQSEQRALRKFNLS